MGLPTGVGRVLLRLLRATKSSQDKSVYVFLTYKMTSFFYLGEVFEVCKSFYPPHFSSHLFLSTAGIMLTSDINFSFFLLKYQQLEVDPYFTPYDSTKIGPEICQIFYFLHSYCRGCWSDASIKHPGWIRKSYPR